MKKYSSKIFCLFLLCALAAVACTSVDGGVRSSPLPTGGVPATATPAEPEAAPSPCASPSPQNTPAITPPATATPAASPQAAQADSNQAATPAYSVATRSVKRDGISVDYPQVEGLANAAVQQTINDTIDQAVQNAIADIGREDTYSLNFEVMTQDEQTLSLVMRGGFYYQGAAHPAAFAYTYNFDLATGQNYSLMAGRDPAMIAQAVQDGKITILNGDEEMKGYILEYLTQVLAPETLGVAMVQADNGAADGVMTFMKDGQLCLVLPVTHALGDYCLVRIDGVQ